MTDLTDHQARYARALAGASGLHPDVAHAVTAVATLANGNPAGGHPATVGRGPEDSGARLGRVIKARHEPGPHQPIAQLRMIADDPALPGSWPQLRRALRDRVMATGGEPVPDPPRPPRLVPAVLAELRDARSQKVAG